MASLRAAVGTGLALLWLAGQAALVATAGERPEHAFGFRMFSEASSLRVSLARQVRSDEHGALRELPCPGGRYVLAAGSEASRTVYWDEWVTRPELGAFDREIFANYGADAQLSRFRAALDSFSFAVPEDRETVRFVLHGEVRRNGAPPEPFRFEGPLRAEAGR